MKKPQSPETTLDALARMVQRGFDEMGSRLDKLSGRTEKVEHRLSGLEDSFRDFRLEVRVSLKAIERDMTGRIERLEEQIQLD